jgi:hypothetical protein
MKKKPCSKCGREFLVSPEFFYRDKCQKDGFASYCKGCKHIPSLHGAIIDGKKKCSNCKQWKLATLEYFKGDSQSESGLGSWCRLCHTTENSRLFHGDNYQQHLEKKIRRQQLFLQGLKECENGKQCKHPQGSILPLTDEYFMLRKGSKDGFRNQCRVCMSARHLENYHQKRWSVHSTNRRARKRSAGGNFTPKDIQKLYAAQKGLCWWCSCKLSKKYHIDHRIPISRGGTNQLDNICLSCPRCNLTKYNKMPWEFSDRLL